jgi:arabinose-5-phosphate isomerase
MLKLTDPSLSNASLWLDSARHTLAVERAGLDQLVAALDADLGEAFVAAVEAISQAAGRIILSGVGKSGHIARKIAATLASTGTPAMFVHATEASHGDLGMITPDDVIVVLSNSGETVELRDLLVYSRRFAVTVIAMTTGKRSTLAKTADIVLVLPRAEEACPIGLAPTTSTTLQLAIGDALAIALLEARGFTASDFQRYHPGGRLGAALTHISEIMHTGDELPLAPAGLDMQTALITMTTKRFGCLGIVDAAGRLIGIVTDGDLRRHMGADLLTRSAGDIMTPDPKVVAPDTLASTAIEMLNAKQITSLFVTDGTRPVGIVHIHDLLRIGVR